LLSLVPYFAPKMTLQISGDVIVVEQRVVDVEEEDKVTCSHMMNLPFVFFLQLCESGHDF